MVRRVSWGYKNLGLISAIAELTADLMDQWKDAKDPWQFLQLAKAVMEHATIARRCVPIRYDRPAAGWESSGC